MTVDPVVTGALVVEPIDLKMILLTRGNTILNEHNWLVRKLYQRVLTERNIEVQYNTEVVGTTKTTSAFSTGSNNGIGVVELTINKVTSSSNKAEDEDDDTTIITTIDNNNNNDNNNNSSSTTTTTATTRTLVVDDCLWCTSASGPSWLSSCTPFETTSGGNFIKVHDTYQVINYPGIFACGDCCHMINHPRPKGKLLTKKKMSTQLKLPIG